MERYLTGNVTDYERLKIEAWLEVMKTERTADIELTDEDQERLFRKITGNSASISDIQALYPKRAPLKRLFSKQWVRVAASVVLLLTASFAVWNLVTDSAPLHRLVAHGTEKIILNDGTIVWLKEGSKFAYYEKDDGTRHARLTGEALFEVAKIPNSSFTITCDKITVGVLGTSFNLKTGAERIELDVLTGKVKLTSVHDSVGVSVTPNQTVIYSVQGEIDRAVLTQKAIAELTENTEYNMQFTNATMEEVIESLARKFDVTITVKDKSLNNCHVTANFTDDALEHSLEILSEVLHISYSIKGKHISLSGKGC